QDAVTAGGGMQSGLHQSATGLDAAGDALREAALRAEREDRRLRGLPVPLLERSLQRSQCLGIQFHGVATVARARRGARPTVAETDLSFLQADHHAAVTLERREELDLLHCRQRRPTGPEVEGGAMVHAPDLPGQHLTVAERVALMGALVGQGVEL